MNYEYNFNLEHDVFTVVKIIDPYLYDLLEKINFDIKTRITLSDIKNRAPEYNLVIISSGATSYFGFNLDTLNSAEDLSNLELFFLFGRPYNEEQIADLETNNPFYLEDLKPNVDPLYWRHTTTEINLSQKDLIFSLKPILLYESIEDSFRGEIADTPNNASSFLLPANRSWLVRSEDEILILKANPLNRLVFIPKNTYGVYE